MSNLNDIAKALLEKDDFLVISHASPDGDTLGSATALIRALRTLGKKADFACGDNIPGKFMFLFKDLENIGFEPKTFVTVDVADTELLGTLIGKYDIDIAVDHHATNKQFAKLNYVDGGKASNTMIVMELIDLLKVDICPMIADSLFTGLSTDTGCFKFSNAGNTAHKYAARLIECGANFKEINRAMFDTKTIGALKVQSDIISKMEFAYDNKILFVSIPLSLLEETGAKSEDLEEIPSIVRSVEGVMVGITLKEKEDRTWKASVRAFSPADAGEICQKFGGGGHRGAGGCAMSKDFEQEKAKLINASIEHLKGLNI